MEDLMMKRVAAKFVTCRTSSKIILSFSQKLYQVMESWCYGYDPESEQQSSEWKSPNSPRPNVARQVHSSFKKMLISHFDVAGIVHREFVSLRQRANQKFYLNVLKRLCKNLQRNNPEKWQSGDWFLHHDSAPAHSTLNVQQFLAKNKIVVVSHHPYSPDLTPCNFSLYPQMKQVLKWRRFDNVAEIQRESLWPLAAFLLMISDNISSSGSIAGITASSHRGQYFEGG
jgi:hypothetical protein